MIKLGPTGQTGIVACSMDDGAYTDAFTERDWAYLKNGVMIQFENGTLIHYEDGVEPDVELVARASTS